VVSTGAAAEAITGKLLGLSTGTWSPPRRFTRWAFGSPRAGTGRKGWEC